MHSGWPLKSLVGKVCLLGMDIDHPVFDLPAEHLWSHVLSELNEGILRVLTTHYLFEL